MRIRFQVHHFPTRLIAELYFCVGPDIANDCLARAFQLLELADFTCALRNEWHQKLDSRNRQLAELSNRKRYADLSFCSIFWTAILIAMHFYKARGRLLSRATNLSSLIAASGVFIAEKRLTTEIKDQQRDIITEWWQSMIYDATI